MEIGVDDPPTPCENGTKTGLRRSRAGTFVGPWDRRATGELEFPTSDSATEEFVALQIRSRVAEAKVFVIVAVTARIFIAAHQVIVLVIRSDVGITGIADRLQDGAGTRRARDRMVLRVVAPLSGRRCC